jgi:predicted dehydrogenase
MTTNHANVRVALIGVGGMAVNLHAPSLASCPDVEMVAMCDLHTERLHAAADQFGVEQRYTDYQQMVEETAPDAVFAIGQPHLLYDSWIWCLQQGLHLYIEKPLGITMHQARMLATLAEQQGCITQVSFQRRACPLMVKMREACLERGPIQHAVATFYKCAIAPYLDARDHMMDDGVHAIDTLRWLCGGEVVKIDSIARRIGTPDINYFTALLHFDTGAVGVLMNSWSSGRRVFRVEMHAPGICAEVEPEGKGRLYADNDAQGVEYDPREVAGSDDGRVFLGFGPKCREFIDAVKNGTLPGSHFGDAVKTMEVAERMLAQALLSEDRKGVDVACLVK